jgi:hypothetical protein
VVVMMMMLMMMLMMLALTRLSSFSALLSGHYARGQPRVIVIVCRLRWHG